MMTTIYKCPVCGKALVLGNRRYVCEAKHSFDISRAGYVNLLLANQKKSKSPGDSEDMLKARRDFLSHGYYDVLAENIASIIEEQIAESGFVADIGCGEGFFLTKIKSLLGDDFSFVGSDISKSAVALACKRDKSINYAVASSFKLPFLSESVGCFLRMFAPGDNSEIVRCLNTGGIFIAVTPGPEHLFSLKEMVYKTPRQHAVKDVLIDGLSKVNTFDINQELVIDNRNDLQNLLKMTPYYWNGDREVKDTFDALTSLKTQINFVITVYQK